MQTLWGVFHKLVNGSSQSHNTRTVPKIKMGSLRVVVFCQRGAQAKPAAVTGVTWSTSTPSDVAAHAMTALPLSGHYHILFTATHSGRPKQFEL